ncbi:ACT domain-containing protein [bacterium]|nr:ACT domain-containing protein [bacterium]
MAVTQLSIFIENKPGRLEEVVSILGKNGINIRALSLADTKDYGVLRIIVDKKDDAVKVLKENGISVIKTSVIAAEVEDTPGGLAGILDFFAEKGINVEYMYAFVEKTGNKAIVVFRVENIKEGENLLKEKGIKVFTDEEIKSL